MTWFAAAASLPGQAHLRIGRGNQDAAACFVDGELVLAAVADGCSEARGAALGAQLAARFLVVDLARCLRRGVPMDELPAVASARLVAQVRRWARGLALDARAAADVVADAFLFTSHSVVVARGRALCFGTGDGVVLVDGAARALPTPADGRPDYLAYRLFERAVPCVVHIDAAAEDVCAIAIGTDGLIPVLAALPGVAKDAALATNPGLLQKRLRALSAQTRLDDDASLVVVARRPHAALDRSAPCA